jgi:flagellar biosynthesis protein FliR
MTALPLATAAGFTLVLCRCSALCMTAPLFGTKSVPARVRVVLAMLLAFVAFQYAGLPPFLGWSSTEAFLIAIIAETIIGLAAGLSSRFFIEAAHSAGSAMGLGMGIGFAHTIDPLHGGESTALSELLAFFALAIAVAAGIHREAIVWLCQSVTDLPPGSTRALPDICGAVVSEALRAIALSVRLTMPVLAAVTFGHVALGLLGRTVPTMSSLNLGFTVAILAGGGALYLVAPGIATIAAREARAVFMRQ